MSKSGEAISVRFRYRGEWRHLDNVSETHGGTSIIGYEHRKRGQYSARIKSFKVAEISELTRVSIPDRVNRP